MTAECQQIDKVMGGAVADVIKVRADLDHAEKEAQENDDGWTNWYEELSEGIDESRSSTRLGGHLCQMTSRKYIASQVPGSVLTDSKMAESMRNKECLREEQRECTQAKEEMNKANHTFQN